MLRRQRKGGRKWLRRTLLALAALACLGLLAALAVWPRLSVAMPIGAPREPDLTLGAAAFRAGPGELKGTTVSAHLDAPIELGRNTLYCATAQLAWNELYDLAGGPLSLEGDPPAAAALNRRQLRRADLDEASLVAAAGLDGPALAKKLRREIGKKFGDSARPEQLGAIEAAPPGAPVAYSMLLKGLPFEWAFTQRGRRNFAGSSVACWGIHRYCSSEEDKKRAATQLQVYDYRGPDDFILEIRTRSLDDQLVLAKVPPMAKLLEQAKRVSARMAASKPETGMDDMADLIVPVIDFDLLHDYADLCGRRIGAPSSKVNGKPMAAFRQGVRFRLDERGAVLRSEVVILCSVDARKVRDLIFDKPFLVMIRRRGAELPYFALWVGNAELMGGDWRVREEPPAPGEPQPADDLPL